MLSVIVVALIVILTVFIGWVAWETRKLERLFDEMLGDDTQ